jgi:hypothetical protein
MVLSIERSIIVEKDFKKEFKSCPCCGSERRFMEELGREVSNRGLARTGWRLCSSVINGVASDPERIDFLPVGTSLPSFHVETDICMDCGAVYAISISRAEATLQLAPGTKNPNKYSPLGISQRNSKSN